MRPFRRLLGYLRPYLAQLAAAVVLLAVAGALMSVAITTFKPLVNDVLGAAPTLDQAPGLTAGGTAGEPSSEPALAERILARLPLEEWSAWLREGAVVRVPLLFLLVFLVRGVALYFGQYLTIKTGASVIRDLRADLYDSLVLQAPSFFRRHQTGTILSRLLNDVQRIQKVSSTAMADLFRVGAMAPSMLIVALWLDWRLTLYSMLLLPVLALPIVRLGKRLRKVATRSQESLGETANLLKETVTGAKVIQAFSMESLAIGRFREALARLLKVDLQAGRAAALSGPILEIVGAGGGAALFYFAGLSAARGRLDAGEFLVVLTALVFLFMSLRRLNQINVELQQALAAATRVFSMMDWPREIEERPGAKALPTAPAGIRFENVEFAYPDEEETVIKGVDFELRRGETVALVGPSGSGKTTIANLMLRFADPSAGRVTVDGHDLRDAELPSLRRLLGLVTQETVLFDDSVAGNIAGAKADATREQIRAAAEAAHAHEFISQLPKGYSTQLGEGGARLSMGQRQRITIARALLKDPPFLILDEATSALDSEAERKVQDALDVLLAERGSLVIAHRLATVREASRILVLDEGRIVQQGTHDQLLAEGGLYARLYELQFQE